MGLVFIRILSIERSSGENDAFLSNSSRLHVQRLWNISTTISSYWVSLPSFGLLSLHVRRPSSVPFISARVNTLTMNDHCRTIADNDLYGRGVRIGMYLQWASGFVLRNFETWETRARVRTTTNVLATAVALATVINVCQGTALSVDYLLSYYLTVVLFYAESYNLEIRLPNDEDGDVRAYVLHADLALAFQNVYFAAFTVFGVWYWLKGINSTPDPVCGGKAALLGVFDIRNSAWVHAAGALAILVGVAFVLVFLVHLTSLSDGIVSGPKLAAVYYARGMMLSRDPMDYSSDRDPEMERKLLVKRLLRPDLPAADSISITSFLKLLGKLVHYFLIYLAGPLIAIVSIERMIAANYLVTASAFGSAGQVIALFTGITSALLACWQIIKNRWIFGSRHPSGHNNRNRRVSTPDSSVNDGRSSARHSSNRRSSRNRSARSLSRTSSRRTTPRDDVLMERISAKPNPSTVEALDSIDNPLKRTVDPDRIDSNKT